MSDETEGQDEDRAGVIGFCRACQKEIDVPFSKHQQDSLECQKKMFPMADPYAEFIKNKTRLAEVCGVKVTPSTVNAKLFAFQRDLVMWALRKGRAALFADTGLGKTFMQLEWARILGGPALIVAPLTVAQQTRDEAAKLDLVIDYVRHQSEVRGQLSITNYEMVSQFDPDQFQAVVLDESSILKSLDGKTRAKLTEMFSRTRYRLCCTATPAPNDIAEIANHSEFLGVMSRVEMLASFFVHDQNGWRLKGHAAEPFYKWLSSWGMSVKFPSDIGHSNDGFILPKLSVEPIFIESEIKTDGRLFFDGLKGIRDRIAVRRQTMAQRCKKAADMINADHDQWLVWCGLNDEGRLLRSLIPQGVNVEGSDSIEEKIRATTDFRQGRIRVMISKSKISGFGLNFQNCHKMAFVGLNDSWEQYYQCVRRSWRFGQDSPVLVKIILSDAEKEIYENVMNKEREAERMSRSLIRHVANYEKDELYGSDQGKDYVPAQSMVVPRWMEKA